MKRILPAYPLWIMDPVFSVWSGYNELNGGNTMFWTGQAHTAYGFVRYNGKTYCFLGKREDVETLRQTEVRVSAFSTEYVFENKEFVLKICFTSPLLPDDLRLMSRPVCYTDYEIIPKGKTPSDLSVAVVLKEDFCYDKEKSETVGGVLPCESYEAAFFTRRRNLVLSNTSDGSAPDYGCTYLTGEESFFVTEEAIRRYLRTGNAEYVRRDGEDKYIMSVNKKPSGFFMTAFDDYISVFYFGEWLRGYYFSESITIVDAMNDAFNEHASVLEKCRAFDEKLRSDCKEVGEDYYILACAALRQSIGAHKLVKKKNGELLFLSKECNSNGCIGTVDVSYPSVPLFLLYNSDLVNAMLRGIFEFAKMPVWTFDFAPHDLGTYPWCSGQVYGANAEDDKYGCGMNELLKGDLTQQMLYIRPAKSNVYGLKNQMPVEECGNMLIMTAAALVAGADIALARDNFDLLTKWVDFLEKYGLRPENQLSTDDFAGHLANNVNLSIKALVGIESYSIICDKLEKNELAVKYLEKAFEFAENIKSERNNGILPLAYGEKGTYSLKYNILFDKLFGFNLIGEDVAEKEVDYYIERRNLYGTPLDTRKDYTKSDWLLWVSAITDGKEKTRMLYEPIVRYLRETPSRLPFGDWYDSKCGEIIHFYNRSVQGGIFAPLLKNSKKMEIKRRK